MKVHAVAQNLIGNDNPYTDVALQRTAISAGPTADTAPHAVSDVLRSAGRTLESGIRASMELGFGQDFSKVRVHDDHAAATSARSVDAHAYTVGNHIAFDTGQYRPETPEGYRLLAHELTHVLQQAPLGLSASEPTLTGHAERSAEHDAESAAHQMVTGFPARPTKRMAPGVIARQSNSEKEPGIFSLDTIAGGLKGEFNEDPTVAMIAVDTIVSLVPGLDQVADARDLAAHLYFMALERQYDKQTRWIGLAFTLIGVIPEVGSAVKSASKFLIKGVREALTHLDDILKIIRRVLPEIGEIGKLRRYIKAHWSTWVKTGTEFFNQVIARLTTAATNGSFLARRVLGRFRGALEMLRDIAPDRLRQAYDDVKKLLDDVLDQIAEHLGIPNSHPSLAVASGPDAHSILQSSTPPPGKREHFSPGRGHQPSELAPTTDPNKTTVAPRSTVKTTEDLAEQASRRVDSDIDEMVERGLREETSTTLRPGTRPRPQAPLARGNASAAREAFDRVRASYARRLGVGVGGQVHHAVELQVLDRYPGAFSATELNDFTNMRGIATESQRRRQLHNSKIREIWDRHYRALDAEVLRRGLRSGTTEYNDFVRSFLQHGRDEIDHVIGMLFTEYRSAFTWSRNVP